LDTSFFAGTLTLEVVELDAEVFDTDDEIQLIHRVLEPCVHRFLTLAFAI